MNAAETRAVLRTLTVAQAAGDVEAVRALLADEVAVIWPESSPIDGWRGPDEVAESLCSGRAPREIGLDPTTFEISPRRSLIDGNLAVVETIVAATTSAGEAYSNRYLFLYEFNDDGKLIELREFGDTLSAALQTPLAWRRPIQDASRRLAAHERPEGRSRGAPGSGA